MVRRLIRVAVVRAARIVRPLTRSSAAAALVVVSVVAGGLLVARGQGALETMELSAFDQFIRLRADGPPDDRIALISISDDDIQALGRWPLTDETLAQTLQALLPFRPRAIGLDMYRDLAVPPGSDELGAVLAAHPEIIGVLKFGDGSSPGVPPHPALRNTDRVGFSDVVLDRGGTVRRGLLFLDDGATTAYSFGFRLALLYLKRDGVAPAADPADAASLRLGRRTIRALEGTDGGYVHADTRGYQFLLDWKGGLRPHRTIPITAVLSGRVDPADIRDRIVLIGVTAESVKDTFFTPFSHGRTPDQQMPGIAVHAHAVSQLLRMALAGERPITSVAEGYEAAWILVASVLGGALGLTARSLAVLLVATTSGIVVLGGGAYLAFTLGWWIPVVPPALGWVLAAAGITAYRSYRERVERATLMNLFSRHVSTEVAEAIWQQRDQFVDGGRPRPQRLTATVLFTDLAGYTSMAESLPPSALVQWLDEYMAAMSHEVIVRGGVINKDIGDAIMAIFGIPLRRTTPEAIARDARAAVDCALAMGSTLTALNRKWREEDRPRMGMRIGIFTGEVVAGTLGSAERSEYTVVGDPVNIASRLESFDKDVLSPDPDGHCCRILVGRSTLERLDEGFETELIGEVHLKGKAHTVPVYAVIGRADEPRLTGEEVRS